MYIDHNTKLDFDDVLLKPKRSDAPSRSSVELEKTYRFKWSKASWTGVPIVASNMDCTGTLAMARELTQHKMMTCLNKYGSIEELAVFFSDKHKFRNHTFYTLGIKDEEFGKLLKVKARVDDIPFLCIDAANGYTVHFVNCVKEVRQQFPNSTIMAGNVCTPEMVSELILSGAADIVKIGIGPGSVCRTRHMTGVGYPQLSAIMECADAAHGLQGHICADGGCREPGHVVKAFAANADFVMLGGMLAGTKECRGQWTRNPAVGPIEGEPKFGDTLRFYGMSSKEAMDKHSGGVAHYRAPEGTCVEVEYKGPVEDVLQSVTGGLRSACTYVGAAKLKHLPMCATFVRVTQKHIPF